jgi:hypothetical protein
VQRLVSRPPPNAPHGSERLHHYMRAGLTRVWLAQHYGHAVGCVLVRFRRAQTADADLLLVPDSEAIRRVQ